MFSFTFVLLYLPLICCAAFFEGGMDEKHVPTGMQEPLLPKASAEPEPAPVARAGAGSVSSHAPSPVVMAVGSPGPTGDEEDQETIVLRQLAASSSRSNSEHTASGAGSGVFRMTIGFNELGLELVSNGARVLQGVTGEIKTGRLTAVMGPSGSGKTTFLSTLAGRATYGKTSGDILINGRRDSLTNYRKLVGFVPQEDVMMRELTVEQNVRHAALCRLPLSMTPQDRDKKIEKVLKLLGLSEIRHSVIGDEITRYAAAC
jgi:ABC-type multidrug transport system fused ATPase/permease subunit